MSSTLTSSHFAIAQWLVHTNLKIPVSSLATVHHLWCFLSVCLQVGLILLLPVSSSSLCDGLCCECLSCSRSSDTYICHCAGELYVVRVCVCVRACVCVCGVCMCRIKALFTLLPFWHYTHHQSAIAEHAINLQRCLTTLMVSAWISTPYSVAHLHA